MNPMKQLVKKIADEFIKLHAKRNQLSDLVDFSDYFEEVTVVPEEKHKLEDLVTSVVTKSKHIRPLKMEDTVRIVDHGSRYDYWIGKIVKVIPIYEIGNKKPVSYVYNVETLVPTVTTHARKNLHKIKGGF